MRKAWWILIACWGSAFSQTDVPLFGPKQGRTAFQNLHVPELHADGTAEFFRPKLTGGAPETSHQCWGKSYDQRICKFKNLLLWNDTFYYITTEESILEQGIPEIPLSWVHIEFAEKMRFAKDSIAQMVRPEDLPFDFASTPKLGVDDAVVWHLTYHDNYGHLMGEHGPTLHNVMCSYMGRCQFSLRDRDVHLLLPHNEDDMMAVVPGAARQMLQCFTKYPPRQTDELIFKDRVLLIKTALVGVGPTCRGFPWCRPNYGRSAVPSTQILRWKERIMQCLQLPTRAGVRTSKPRVLVVKRPLHVGRGFLNLDQMIEVIQDAYPGEVAVHVLDGKPLAQQAALFSNASLVIQAHGAALGNMIFLPAGASVIDVSPVNHEDKHAWVFFMAADFRALRLNPIRIPEQKAVPMHHLLTAYRQWFQLSLAQRAQLLDTGICPSDEEVGFQFSTNIWCKFYWILKHSNMMINIQELKDAVVLARRSFEELGNQNLPLSAGLSHAYSHV